VPGADDPNGDDALTRQADEPTTAFAGKRSPGASGMRDAVVAEALASILTARNANLATAPVQAIDRSPRRLRSSDQQTAMTRRADAARVATRLRRR
jgi:hypothetical protein